MRLAHAPGAESAAGPHNCGIHCHWRHELALACAGALSEPIRDRAARSGLHLWDGSADPS